MSKVQIGLIVGAAVCKESPISFTSIGVCYVNICVGN